MSSLWPTRPSGRRRRQRADRWSGRQNFSANSCNRTASRARIASLWAVRNGATTPWMNGHACRIARSGQDRILLRPIADRIDVVGDEPHRVEVPIKVACRGLTHLGRRRWIARIEST